ncbi:hypothetical protein [Flammeovirga aprica]|uniref:Uncharacterized protein n=1 Tax=Flammeovirga aprica JL-4 TaxID=694437 RepID=A0A7X9P044_9BACT|nr:hypothetical protein [Flammeovirga aprica]NME67121.1 hypothetical protein [Flammeovirga aprica JL-4]
MTTMEADRFQFLFLFRMGLCFLIYQYFDKVNKTKVILKKDTLIVKGLQKKEFNVKKIRKLFLKSVSVKNKNGETNAFYHAFILLGSGEEIDLTPHLENDEQDKLSKLVVQFKQSIYSSTYLELKRDKITINNPEFKNPPSFTKEYTFKESWLENFFQNLFILFVVGTVMSGLSMALYEHKFTFFSYTLLLISWSLLIYQFIKGLKVDTSVQKTTFQIRDNHLVIKNNSDEEVFDGAHISEISYRRKKIVTRSSRKSSYSTTYYYVCKLIDTELKSHDLEFYSFDESVIINLIFSLNKHLRINEIEKPISKIHDL